MIYYFSLLSATLDIDGILVVLLTRDKELNHLYTYDAVWRGTTNDHQANVQNIWIGIRLSTYSICVVLSLKLGIYPATELLRTLLSLIVQFDVINHGCKNFL